MKKRTLLFATSTLIASLLFTACSSGPDKSTDSKEEDIVSESLLDDLQYDNGRYRGVFADRGYDQVSIQFSLEDNKFKDLSFRHLFHNDTDYRELQEGDDLYPVALQHQQILDYLDGKSIEALFDLYDTSSFVEDIDAFSGATIRGNKVLSAIRDGLNRGLYTPADQSFSRHMENFEDGRYRGVFADRGYDQVSIQFSLEDNKFKDLSFRHLFHNDTDYRELQEGDDLYPVALQHQQILDYLDGKSIEALFDLYDTSSFVEDIDAFSGATIRGNKVLSAIRDGLNRGIY